MPPDKLHLRIDTVCGTREQIDVDYATPTGAAESGPVVVVARVAPPEAPCSLTVTATIANSSLSVSTLPVSGAMCSCPADGGTGGAGGTGGGG